MIEKEPFADIKKALMESGNREGLHLFMYHEYLARSVLEAGLHSRLIFGTGFEFAEQRKNYVKNRVRAELVEKFGYFNPSGECLGHDKNTD